jgi:hypothetical protein
MEVKTILHRTRSTCSPLKGSNHTVLQFASRLIETQPLIDWNAGRNCASDKCQHCANLTNGSFLSHGIMSQSPGGRGLDSLSLSHSKPSAYTRS